MCKAPPHICICICTYKRPEYLRNLLSRLQNLETNGKFTYSVNVVDNDPCRSSMAVVEEMKTRAVVGLNYLHEPKRNIAAARNKAMENAEGDYAAFIDDDELPERDWLLNMHDTLEKCGADGVLGPVNPYFESEPPDWIVKGKFCERPAHETGKVLHWSQSRTGNVLFRLGIIEDRRNAFDEDFGLGGEDVRFFKNLAGKGRVFVWCNESPVKEMVPKERCTKKYFLKRSFLQGNVSANYYKDDNEMKHRSYNISKSAMAILSYTIILPGALLLGTEIAMKYLTKHVYHVGRLLSSLGIRTIKERYI
ncbi:MAG: glycosyltransferase family 2 protein [Deltaproteobacteria bacterium]